MSPIVILPIALVLGFVLLAAGLVYGLTRAGGGRRLGDAAADAGAKADVSPGARGAAVAAVALGILLLLGSGITAWQYEARAGGQPANSAGLANLTGQASKAQLSASVGAEAPTYNEKNVTSPQAAQANVNARTRLNSARQGQAAANG